MSFYHGTSLNKFRQIMESEEILLSNSGNEKENGFTFLATTQEQVFLYGNNMAHTDGSNLSVVIMMVVDTEELLLDDMEAISWEDSTKSVQQIEGSISVNNFASVYICRDEEVIF